jgi:diguanylate cyclase (GGDEF)-like protein
VGDKVLRAVTDAIQEHLRSYDLAGRFGGEEFVVLLPQARAADAVNIAERLRTHIAAMAIPVGNGGEGDASANGAGKDAETYVRLTISVGVAALNDATRELTDLMAAADAALYFAKQTGRNKTHAHVPAGGPPAAVAGSVATGSLGAEESPTLQKAK